jgi:CSLREA domain-containing protein
MSRGNRRVGTRRGSIFAAVLAGMIVMFSAVAAHAATTIIVDTTDDDTAAGHCTLREAINSAIGQTATGTCATGSGPFTINFKSTLVGATITLGSQLPSIPELTLTITGPNPASSAGITISGNNAIPIMTNAGTLTLQYLTLANGKTDKSRSGGGAIFNAFGASLTISNCTFSGNQTMGPLPGDTDVGGAIANFHASLTITNSTFSANTATGGPTRGFGEGGAIFSSQGTVTITNSTFSGNIATGGPGSGVSGGVGGAIFSDFDILTISNVTVSGNQAVGNAGAGGGIYFVEESSFNIQNTILAANTGGNCLSIISDDGYNLSDDCTCGFTATGSQNNVADSKLQLGSLTTTNGGPTATIALGSSSIAVGAIPIASCTYPAGSPNPCATSGSEPNQLTCDQRGQPRPGFNSSCDIGAYERSIDCSNAVASNPNLTALLPVYFMPEYVFGVNDQARPFNLKITGVTQDKPVPGLPLCPNAFWSGTTTYVRTNNEPLQPGPSGLLYQIQFTATDVATGASCKGSAPVCVQGLFQSGKPCLASLQSYDATRCPK